MSTNRRLQNGKQPPNTCRRICDFYYTKMLLVTMATKRWQSEGGALFVAEWIHLNVHAHVVFGSG